jgi:hypothetical protein
MKKFLDLDPGSGMRKWLDPDQGCGSGSGFRDFLDPDPYWESGSRGKKIKKFQWKKCTFYLFFTKILPLKRYKIALTTF